MPLDKNLSWMSLKKPVCMFRAVDPPLFGFGDKDSEDRDNVLDKILPVPKFSSSQVASCAGQYGVELHHCRASRTHDQLSSQLLGFFEEGRVFVDVGPG